MKTKNFVSGLKMRHAAIPLTAFVTLGVLLILADAALKNGGLAYLPLAWVLRSDYDPFVQVSHQLAQIKKSGENPAYVFFGGSSLRESVESPAKLEQEISRGVEKRAVKFLVSTQQNWGETIALVENLPRNGSTLVFGVNPSRFSRTRAEYLDQLEGKRLGLSSEKLAEFMGHYAPSHWTWNSSLPFVTHWARDWMAVNRPALQKFEFPVHTFPEHAYDESTRLTSARKWKFYEKYVAHGMVPRFFENVDFNFEALRFLTGYARAQGFSVVLMELPLFPEFISPLRPVLEKYEPRIRSFARAENIPYWDFARSLDWHEQDFNDLFHLLPSGRQKFLPALVAQMKTSRVRPHAPVL